MAAKVVKRTTNWAELEKRVPSDQKAKYIAFKAKSDAYDRKLQAIPPEPPKIDWEKYQKLVPVKGMVENMKMQYEALKVPYPKDTLTAEIDEQWKELKPEINKYCDEMKRIIQKNQKELDRVDALPSYEEMTMEMYFQMHPNEALDFVCKPTFWPHTRDEQLDYVDPLTKTKH